MHFSVLSFSQICVSKIKFNHALSKKLVRTLSTKMEVKKDKVDTEILGKLFLIQINRPEKRNCVDNETAGLLTEAFQHFNENEQLKVAILHGKGGNFCAGFDLKFLSKFEDSMEQSLKHRQFDTERPMGPSKMLFRKPVIAAVPGYAVAGGLELALMCDMRVIEETTVFGVFCRRFGVPLIDGGTIRLPKLIGLSRALDLILTGRPIESKEALQFGLANRIVPTGSALGEAMKLAHMISNFPEECMLADRQSAYYSSYDAESFEDAFDFEFKHGLDVIEVESIKGAKKFAEGTGRHGHFGDVRKSKL